MTYDKGTGFSRSLSEKGVRMFNEVYNYVDEARVLLAKAIYKLDKDANKFSRLDADGKQLTVSNVDSPGSRTITVGEFAEEINNKLEEISERLTALYIALYYLRRL
jgi:hypothetical protein